jgi:hypothetical protein
MNDLRLKLLTHCCCARLRAAQVFPDFCDGRAQRAGGDCLTNAGHVVGLLNER